MIKILVVIASDIYVRNYLTTDALSELETHFDCHFLADRKVSQKHLLEEKTGFMGFYDVDSLLERRHQLLFNVMMWRHRKKSRTFFYRWLRNSQWHLVDKAHGLGKFIYSTLRWLLSASINAQGLIIPLLGNRVIFPISSRVLQRKIPINSDLSSLIQGERYDLVIFPSSGFGPISADIARACEPLKVPSLCLIDNWDNLSSKTVFWAKPTHLGVWGPQAKNQAIQIHGFSPEQIHEIGTPRFDQYFKTESGPSKLIYDFPYVLFVGSAMPFDEISALRAIEDIILKSNTVPKSLRVIYRPHPWQQKRIGSSRFDPETFSRVQLDKQFEGAQTSMLSEQFGDTTFQPDLSYYPKLLHGASCVVGPLTTMLLEASICLRPVIGLNFSDGIHGNTSRRYFSHFDGAEKIPGFTFCDLQEDLASLLHAAIFNKPIQAGESAEAIGYFLHQSPIAYKKRLLNLVRSITKTSH
jgi:hypothetical protein